MIKIYLITNDLNDKKYVGQTTKSLETRFSRHCWASEHKKNMPISLAIKKYGKDHFKISLIEEVENLESANKQEVYWANFYNCFSPNGYNLKAGGRKYLEMSQETKDKISKINIGRKASLETRKKLSDSHKGNIKTKETREKLSKANKGKPQHPLVAEASRLKNFKRYLYLNPEGKEVEIKNMRQFCKENNDLKPVGMSSIINNPKKHTYKGWKFVRFLSKD